MNRVTSFTILTLVPIRLRFISSTAFDIVFNGAMCYIVGQRSSSDEPWYRVDYTSMSLASVAVPFLCLIQITHVYGNDLDESS